MSLAEFVDDVREREKTLTVFTDEESIVEELREFFEVQNIAVRRGQVEGDAPDDFVVLHQEGEAVAVSTLSDVRESLFLGGGVGTDTRRLQVDAAETPDVIGSLGNTTFTADGEDDHLLAQIAHYIADLAFRTGAGAVHTDASRITVGTGPRTRASDVDRKLLEAGVEVHVYGDPEDTVEGTVLHGVDAAEFERARFVVFDGDGDDADKAALVVTTGDGNYRGFWTFEAKIVDEILGYLRATYGGR